MPQVVQRLACQVGQEVPGDDNEQAPAPDLIATDCAVQVKGRAAVFRFFTGMPQPQVTQPRLGPLQRLRMGQQVFGKDGGQVLGGGGDAQPGARRQAFKPALAPAQDARLPVIRKTLGQQLVVEQLVDAPVCGLLANEGLYLVGPARLISLGQLWDAHAHRVDEHLFTGRKAHRQRVEVGTAKSIAPIPAFVERRLQIDQKTAHHKLCHVSALLALWNMRIHGLGAATSPPLQLISALR